MRQTGRNKHGRLGKWFYTGQWTGAALSSACRERGNNPYSPLGLAFARSGRERDSRKLGLQSVGTAWRLRCASSGSGRGPGAVLTAQPHASHSGLRVLRAAALPRATVPGLRVIRENSDVLFQGN